jgi:hypothetical protein
VTIGDADADERPRIKEKTDVSGAEEQILVMFEGKQRCGMVVTALKVLLRLEAGTRKTKTSKRTKKAHTNNHCP